MIHFIETDDVGFTYNTEEERPTWALEHVSLAVKPGEYVSILGRNGSGKSTFARLLNGLELPSYGSVTTAGFSTADDHTIYDIRRSCGMVFQNPDNQIVGTTVEEDVAFGPENIGIPLPELGERVQAALETVGLEEKAQLSPTGLSGGQKQKLAIAGVLAMSPDCLVLDEATSMLDPASRHELMRLVSSLREEKGMSVVQITHHMDEVLSSDRVIVMADGHVLLSGYPADIFQHVAQIRGIGLDVPVHVDIADQLARRLGRELVHGSTADPEQAHDTILGLLRSKTAVFVPGHVSAQFEHLAHPEMQTQPEQLAQPEVSAQSAGPIQPDQLAHIASRSLSPTTETVVDVQHLSCVYDGGTGIRTQALTDVSFSVRRGEFFGIMGHTGSGKSTLIQHLNGLLKVQQGQVRVMDYDLRKNADIKKLRRHVGLLFQYPEHQLFAETCRQDIAFGPTRLGLAPDEVDQRIKEAAAIVDLTDDILDKSPFELSGGQKRRVAIAGILAMRPDILVLDEPAASLDPVGREDIFNYINELRRTGVTVILVSHNMDELARLADRVLLLQDGKVAACGPPSEIFQQADVLKACHVTVPDTVRFLRMFESDLPGLDPYQYSAIDAVDELLRVSSSTSGSSTASEGHDPSASEPVHSLSAAPTQSGSSTEEKGGAQ